MHPILMVGLGGAGSMPRSWLGRLAQHRFEAAALGRQGLATLLR